MFQLVYVPSLGVLVDIVWLTTLPFSNSIFTSDPTLPDDVHFIVGFVPITRDSPPFGAVTVIVDTVVAWVRAKYVLLVSVIAVLDVLVIRIR